MTIGSTGSQLSFNSSLYTKVDPYGYPQNVPYGMRRSRDWNGGDSIRPHFYQVIAVPAKTQIVERRRRDGSTFFKEVVIQKSRVVRKKFYTTGFWPPNTYSNDVRGATMSIGRIYYGHYPCQPSGIWRLFTGPYIPSVPSKESIFTSNDDIRIISKLGARINDSDFNPAVFAATVHMSLETIADRAKKLAKSIAYLRKGDVRRSFHAVYGHYPPKSRKINGDRYDLPIRNGRISAPQSRAVAQTVLEIQYGWRPLVNDAYEGAVWLAAKLKKPMVHRQVQRLQRVGPASDLKPKTWISFTQQQVLVKKQIVAYLSEGFADSSLNLWNPAEMAWELLPWSFVVDWFIPIGEYLNARGVASKLTGTFVTTTTYQKKFWGSRFYGDPARCEEITNILDWGGIPPTWYETQISRSVSNSLIADLPTFKGLKKAASFEHCVNAVALLTAVMHEPPDGTLRKLGRLRN
ncbi:maturation protein [ssRNA phage SRR5467090_3]|uniref:Maturation protein n=1 Tax=ssRNA phage SRR5467090_3 TaxID=2786452 RepID=A0A8S5L563_9VIRU|nr:maturation protein [ssRNA phage SRR5467090_3]DAD52477.1 TPA_asm: maturation protein [ssRNA phage SRR5467090_3]